MPLYEYQCQTCGEIRQEFSSIAEREIPRDLVCVDRPLHPIEEAAIAAGQAKQSTCKFVFIVGAPPTTFRFNDFIGFGGLDRRRDVRRSKKDPVR